MKSVLILGGGGFIGRNILETLLLRGDCFVTAADIKKGSNWDYLSKNTHTASRFTPIIGDFSKIDSFKNLNNEFDEVYMLAAIVGVNETLKAPERVIRVNTLLTMNLLEWVLSHPVKKILFASSSENYACTSEVFGIEIPTQEDVPLCISDVCHPRWSYAMTKMHGELAFMHSAPSLNYDCVIVRYQNIIGPEMGFGHAIPHIVERFIKLRDSKFKVYGHNQTRAFCYITDAVAGTIGAMEEVKTAGEIYHIGNDEEITMETLTSYIGTLLNYDGCYESAQTYPGSVSRRCPNIQKASDDFNYSPSVSWKKAVDETVKWYYEFFSKGNTPPTGGFEPPESVTPRLKK